MRHLILLFIIVSFCCTVPCTLAAPVRAAVKSADVDLDGWEAESQWEREFIDKPAQEERDAPKHKNGPLQHVDAVTLAKQVAARPARPTLSIVSVEVSGDTTLASLCQQIPLAPTADHASLAPAHLASLLRSFWIDSGLLQAEAGAHVLRVNALEAQLRIIQTAFASTDAVSSTLREEDLPEVFEATQTVMKTLSVDLAAEARLDAVSTLDPEVDSSFASNSMWSFPIKLLSLIGLQPNGADEEGAMRMVFLLSAVAVLFLGLGWAVGQRSRSRNPAAALQNALHHDDRHGDSVRRNWAVICFWAVLILAFIVFVLLGFGIRRAYNEEEHRRWAVKLVAEQMGRPRGCSADDAPGLFTQMYRSWGGPSNDPCVKYLHDTLKVVSPDPMDIAIKYLVSYSYMHSARTLCIVFCDANRSVVVRYSVLSD
jgi:hypothetical protein